MESNEKWNGNRSNRKCLPWIYMNLKTMYATNIELTCCPEKLNGSLD